MSNPRERLHGSNLRARPSWKRKLHYIAENYQEVLDEAVAKNTPMLEVLASLIAGEITARRQRALERRIGLAKLPPRKTLEVFDFTFPKRIPKQKVLRLFDCEFVAQHRLRGVDRENRDREEPPFHALGTPLAKKASPYAVPGPSTCSTCLPRPRSSGRWKELREYTRSDLLRSTSWETCRSTSEDQT